MALVSVMRSRLTAGLTAFCLLGLSSVPAIGCGDAFLFSVFFQKYPEARSVITAEGQSREVGALQGDEWSGIGLQSLHSWRGNKVSDMVEALQRRLNSSAQSSGPKNGIYVFLIKEFVWIEIRFDGDQAVVLKAPSAPNKEAPKVFTTRRVLDSLLNKTITWQQVQDNGLIGSRCADGCTNESLAFLGRMFGAIEGT